VSLACVGSLKNPTTLCGVGYEGPLCAVCSSGYGKTSPFTCSECLPAGLNSFIYLILFFFGVGFVYWLILSASISSARGGELGAIAKVTLNYLQGLFYLGQLSANWSDVAKKMFDISGQASMTLNFLSFDCDMKMDYYSRLVLVFFSPCWSVVLSLSST